MDEEDACFEACSVAHNSSITPDRHGFLGGSQYSTNSVCTLPKEVVIRREKKWLKMIKNWDKTMSHHYEKLRDRCRKGIPSSVRPQAWFYLCGGYLLHSRNPGCFERLCRTEGESKCIADIKKDIHRQFPHHIMFTDEHGVGQQELYKVLKCYSLWNPEVGFCQAQAPLAAFLLIHMPAEHAFWCLVSISDRYLQGYYNENMETIQLDGDILFGLLKRTSPTAYRHLKKQSVEPVFYMSEWFLCLFTRSLPWSCILRLWDIFLCEGVKIIFKAALVIIKYSLENRAVLKNCVTMVETLEVLRKPPSHILQEDFLITQILRLDLTEEDFHKQHRKQVKKRKRNSAKKLK